MYMTGLPAIPRKSGLAKYPPSVRAVRNPNFQQSILTQDQAPGGVPGLARRPRQGGAESSAAGDHSRCGEKGCVFPADPSAAGMCRHHHHQQREPALFHSLQVTGLLLDAAKLGLPNCKRDLARQQDRRRLEAIRERFLEELA